MKIFFSLIAIIMLVGGGCTDGTDVSWHGPEDAAVQVCINQGGVPIFQDGSRTMTDCKFKQ